MCGIAGIYIKDPDVIKSHRGLESFVDDLLKGIEHRGRKATGFVAVGENGTVKIDKAPVPASKFVEDRERLPDDTRVVLLHTRLDTKGSPNDSRNNHPVIHKTCFITHNGWVRNDDELFSKYEFNRIAEVDSEIIAAMLYDSNFDVEKMKAAFDEMEGSIACAAIDPIRHPGKLVLARAEHSPLEYVDTPKFLVWASEKKAIREAWGRHIGSPPKDKRISSLDRMKMLIVTPDGVEEVKIPFTPKTIGGTWMGGRYTPTIGSRSTSGSTRSDTDTSAPTQFPLVSTSEIKEIVTRLRENLGGKAKLWTEKGKYPLPVGIGPWLLCDTCDTRVHKDDLRDSTRGSICEDCYETWMTLSAERRNEEAARDKPWHIVNNGELDEDYRPLLSLFNLEQRRKFNALADDDDFVHKMVLTQMSDKLGFSVEAMDYILFRAPAHIVNDVPGFKDWRVHALDLYDVEYLAMWDFYDPDDDFDEKVVKALTPEAKSEQKALPPAGGSTAQVPTFRVLFEKYRATPNGKCRFCKSKCKSVVARAETQEEISYCNKHFALCGTEGCKKPANHTRSDGIRVCHVHARGVKECYADTYLKDEGYLVGQKG